MGGDPEETWISRKDPYKEPTLSHKEQLDSKDFQVEEGCKLMTGSWTLEWHERLERWENRFPKATGILVTTMSQDYTHQTKTACVLPVTATQESRPHATTAWDSLREAGNLAINVRKSPPFNAMCRPNRTHLQAGYESRASSL